MRFPAFALWLFSYLIERSLVNKVIRGKNEERLTAARKLLNRKSSRGARYIIQYVEDENLRQEAARQIIEKERSVSALMLVIWYCPNDKIRENAADKLLKMSRVPKWVYRQIVEYGPPTRRNAAWKKVKKNDRDEDLIYIVWDAPPEFAKLAAQRLLEKEQFCKKENWRIRHLLVAHAPDPVRREAKKKFLSDNEGDEGTKWLTACHNC